MSAYKLVTYAGRPVMKLSPGQATALGAKQVYRGPGGDVLALRDEPPRGLARNPACLGIDDGAGYCSSQPVPRMTRTGQGA